MDKYISSKDADVDKIMGSLQEFGSPIPGASVSSLPQLIATERRMCSAAESDLLLEMDHLVIPILSSFWRNNFRLLFFLLTSGASSGASTGSRGTSCDSSSTGSGTSSSSSSSSVQEDLEASLQFSMSRDLGSQDWLWRWREKE